MYRRIKKMIACFTVREKLQLVFLTFVILVDAFVELLGVSAILPFLSALMAPDEVMNQKYVKYFVDMFGLSESQLVILICAFLIFAYLIKNVILIYVTNLQLRFSYYGRRDMQNLFMKHYLSKDYPFHLVHNSAELMRDICNDTDMFYSTVLNFLMLVSEGIICVVLVVFLFIQDTVITVGVAGSLSVMVLIFMGSYKKKLVSLGNDRRYYHFRQTQAMQQGFGGIKEILVSQNEQYFMDSFKEASGKLAEANKKNIFLNAIPKPTMEVLAISGVMVMIIIKISNGVNPVEFIGVLGVFAVAAFRLLPSVNKVSSYIGNILHNGVVIDDVYSHLMEIRESKKQQDEHAGNEIPEKSEVRDVSLTEKISVNDITFGYDGSPDIILENLSLDIPKDKSVAIIGASGAGKTTLVDIILGLLKPKKGSISVDGINIEDNLSGFRNIIGYIPQTIYMLDDTVRNNITFGKEWGDGDETVWEVLEKAQLREFVESLPEGLDTMIGEAGVRLSGGQRQRIGIARALYRKPQVLILDEATSALDNDTETAVMQAIERLQGNCTMIIIAHRLTTIKNCDYIYEVGNKTVKRTTVD